jgi:hypothetical protein
MVYVKRTEVCYYYGLPFTIHDGQVRQSTVALATAGGVQDT